MGINADYRINGSPLGFEHHLARKDLDMNRAFLTFPAAVLMSAGLMFVTAAPASAATAETCATVPTQVRQAVTTVDAGTARRALGYVAIGEKLCEAGNERAANKKFGAAIRAIGMPESQQLAAR
jgi:hypothetical protein